LAIACSISSPVAKIAGVRFAEALLDLLDRSLIEGDVFPNRFDDKK